MNEEFIIDVLSGSYPNLDLRKGTALRDLLIRPYSYLFDLSKVEIEKLKNVLTLDKSIVDDLTESELEGVLSLYGSTPGISNKASGNVLFEVITKKNYSIPAGLVLGAGEKLYIVKENKFISEDDLVQNDNGKYEFTVEIEADEAGSLYNLPIGSSLTLVDSVFLVNYEIVAVTDISGGTETKTFKELLSLVQANSLVASPKSRTSILGFIKNIDPLLIDARVVGLTDEYRLRDRANIYGVQNPSNVEVYIKSPIINAVHRITGEPTATGYNIPIPEFLINSGFVSIRSIVDVDSEADFGYNFTLASTMLSNKHDLSPGSDYEFDKTIYRVCSANIVTGNNAAPRDFEVQVYKCNKQREIQTAIDMESLTDDIIVRVPYLVSCSLTAKIKISTDFNSSGVKTEVKNYIDNLVLGDFPNTSDIIYILRSNGVSYVDSSSNGLKLRGLVGDVDSTKYIIAGGDLDIKRSAASDNVYINPFSVTYKIEHDWINFIYV